MKIKKFPTSHTIESFHTGFECQWLTSDSIASAVGRLLTSGRLTARRQGAVRTRFAAW